MFSGAGALLLALTLSTADKHTSPTLPQCLIHYKSADMVISGYIRTGS